MLTRRGIEENLDKFHTIIDMRSPPIVMEVQQLIRHLVALSRFLSYAGDKTFHFPATLRKKDNFEWTEECEEAFTRLKTFLETPPDFNIPSKGRAIIRLFVSIRQGSNEQCVFLREG